MASLNATTSSGIVATADNTGTLQLQSAGTTIANVTSTGLAVTGALTTNGIVSSPFAMKNRIINGDMQIDQRNSGASQTITGGASTLAFNCDRWQVRSAGANATVQQINTNNSFRMRFTGAASVSQVAASQSIEALNCVDLAGGTATLSLVASSTSLTTLTLEAYYANTTNTFGTWGSPTVTLIGSQSVNISTTESLVTYTFAVPSAATTGIQIRIIGGALGATQTLTIGNVQLERGSTATSYEWLPISTELALCQRYLPAFVSTSSGDTNGFMLWITSTTAWGAFVPIVQPRVPPTGFTGTASEITVRAAASSNTVASSVSYAGGGLGLFLFNVTIGAAAGAANATGFWFLNTPNARILWTGCEL